MFSEIKKSFSVSDTEAAGAALAGKLASSGLFFIALEGDLGAGKTAFCRGAASVISPGSRVKSPSYTIVNEYRRGAVPLFHFDLYRLGENADLEDVGFYEYVSTGHCIVEWSEFLNGEKPSGAVTVKIKKDSESERTIEIIYPDCFELPGTNESGSALK